MPTHLSVIADVGPSCILAADLPPDILLVVEGLAASNDARRPRADPCGAPPRPALGRQPYFEIYRADEVSLTSILFSGGDWRWRFCSGSGAEVASSGGYASERECAAAVAALRESAAIAELRGARAR